MALDQSSPTALQQAGIDWVLREVEAGTPVVALLGLAGTGKTTLIPHLVARCAERKRPVVVATPTHRAAFVLRQKGLVGVGTVHSTALTAYFTPPYAAALRYLGGWGATREGNLQALDDECDADKIPSLLHGQKDEAAHYAALAEDYDPQKVLTSLGIHGRDYFDGFGPKPPSPGVLIIDEASMVGVEMLALCRQVFRSIVLVGDPGQLPPVRETPTLATVPGFLLTDIHRQAHGSPLIHLAHRTREGFRFWRRPLQAYYPAIERTAHLEAWKCMQFPLLVWRNATRVACTHLIRATLGYPPDALAEDEPLVCRSTDAAARVDGWYNNGLFRVTATDPYDSRLLTVADALTGEEQQVVAHLEELDGANIPLDAIPFRFGYCLTAHTAQGGEWPAVAISGPDLKSFEGYAYHHERMDELAQWAYTALTRAKGQVALLEAHQFI